TWYRLSNASRSSISPGSTALSGRMTTSTLSTSSRAATSIRSTRLRSSRSDGANWKKPNDSLASSCSGTATGPKSDPRTRTGHGRSKAVDVMRLVPGRRLGTLYQWVCTPGTCTEAYRDSERTELPFRGVRIFGSTRSRSVEVAAVKDHLGAQGPDRLHLHRVG